MHVWAPSQKTGGDYVRGWEAGKERSTSHHTKGRKQIAAWVGGKGWDDCMEWPLVWSQAVGMARIQNEIMSAILKCETAAFGDDSCNKLRRKVGPCFEPKSTS
jgi:hypothetical protein